LLKIEKHFFLLTRRVEEGMGWVVKRGLSFEKKRKESVYLGGERKTRKKGTRFFKRGTVVELNGKYHPPQRNTWSVANRTERGRQEDRKPQAEGDFLLRLQGGRWERG